MTNQELQEILCRQAEGARATSKACMALRQLEWAKDSGQRGALTSGEQKAMGNVWGGHADARNNYVLAPQPTTLTMRIIQWFKRLTP